MTDGWIFGPELKPWEKYEDGTLHGADYAAGAVFGVAEMTYKHLLKVDLEPTAINVQEYAKIFGGILIRSQAAVGPGGWASTLNTRMRGALWTALDVVASEEELGRDQWLNALQETVTNIARTAAWLYRIPARELAGA